MCPWGITVTRDRLDSISRPYIRGVKTDASRVVYAVYEVTRRDNDRLRAVFPGTADGCQAALDWAATEFDSFAAARSPEQSAGDGYLTRCSGVKVVTDV